MTIRDFAVDIPEDIQLSAQLAAPPQGRVMLAHVTDLFLQQAGQLTQEQTDVFDVVMSMLADRIEADARAELSERLAHLPDAPRGLVQRLAQDVIIVARPVLERSPLLADTDLVTIASELGQDHMMAIARRSTLAESVTAVLVDRGSRPVLRTLAGNDGARFALETYERLVGHAHNDDVLQDLIAERRDVTPTLLQRLVAVAGGVAQSRLLKASDARTARMVQDAVRTSQTRLARLGTEAERIEAQEIADVTELYRQGALNEDTVLRVAREGRRAQAFAALALMADLPASIATRIFVDPDDELLLIICKGLGFRWETAQALQAFRLRHPHRPFDPLRLRNSYERLSPATTTRVLRFLRSRQDAGTGPRPLNA